MQDGESTLFSGDKAQSLKNIEKEDSLRATMTAQQAPLASSSAAWRGEWEGDDSGVGEVVRQFV